MRVEFGVVRPITLGIGAVLGGSTIQVVAHPARELRRIVRVARRAPLYFRSKPYV